MKSNSVLIKNADIYLESEIIPRGYVLVNNGKIAEAGQDPSHILTDDIIVVNAEDGSKLIPGFIDVHIHGAAGADTMDATPEAIHTIASALPAEGTTSFLATTITQGVEEIEAAVINAGNYRGERSKPGEAEVLGIHLEGPFINPSKKGAQPEKHIIAPDIELFKKWQTVSGNSIKLVTVAPEQPNGLPFISFLHETGVVASMGHSDATFEQMEAAVKAGARQVTHLFNGMRGLHHREPGVAGAALLMKDLHAEIIADGNHVRPEMIQLAVNAKGKEGIILITDSMRAKCMRAGTYDLGGQEVTVENGQALLEDGTLAGSILKMVDSVKNMLHFTDLELADVIRLASENPAKQLGVYDRKGSIAKGKDADLVLLNADLQITATYCRGASGYSLQ
ncbi:N-acetylglucosamine-6-phosphate deacetylase [Peribacillus deserti]|uniref:N-acetylglucosamine-6-phosphate deacetylase n=1 Tax=Peribacillus deserti TaxID=673318 RepID=A0ABS2QCU1_9BACI|nr:N-acetylglucosamine-6-phosphate deacetylase [Peribacillus deserti]MBM7690958.1 N-acetylglucosamine-6-phosphate deacetylase [Peribacillus deserti]